MGGRKYRDMADHIRYHEMTDGTKIPYLDALGLIQLKEGSSREKDRIDVGALTRISRETMESKESVSLDKLRRNPPAL